MVEALVDHTGTCKDGDIFLALVTEAEDLYIVSMALEYTFVGSYM